MTDEAWDDDDFGTFESADASNLPKPADSNTPSAATPAWLLAAQQERHDQGMKLFKDLQTTCLIFYTFFNIFTIYNTILFSN